ncbi:MAG: hypothetical protein GWN13_28205 [Phycisphaerae bacterium]|nr:hypothetical protein [Phycisphaerae bacterium]
MREGISSHPDALINFAPFSASFLHHSSICHLLILPPSETAKEFTLAVLLFGYPKNPGLLVPHLHHAPRFYRIIIKVRSDDIRIFKMTLFYQNNIFKV